MEFCMDCRELFEAHPDHECPNCGTDGCVTDDLFICSNCGEWKPSVEMGTSELAQNDEICIDCMRDGYGK